MAFWNLEAQTRTAVMDVFVQWGVRMKDSCLCLKRRELSIIYSTDSLGCHPSHRSRQTYVTDLCVRKMNLQTGLARLSTTWRVKGFNKSKGQLEENLPQAILKLLGRTLPLMTGLKGQPGISGFVMNSTTWLGLLLPSELYAATWRRCRNAEINK